MERKKLIEAEHSYRRGHLVDGIALHPTALTQSELDKDSNVSFPWDLHKRQIV
jgi:hypothetical protein